MPTSLANKYMPNWKKLTVKQLENHIRDFAGTEYATLAREELKRRSIQNTK
jgi:hypothetical protein